MDDLARNRMSSEKVSSIADRPWRKKLEPWWTYFSETFFLKVPQWVDSKLWNHRYPPHTLIPSLRVHLPPFWGVLGHLRTIFRSGSRWEMDVLYHVPLTFTTIPGRGWRIHHQYTGLWTGFTHFTRDTRGRHLSYVIFPICKKWKKVPLKPSGTWTTRSNSRCGSKMYKPFGDEFNDTLWEICGSARPCSTGSCCVSSPIFVSGGSLQNINFPNWPLLVTFGVTTGQLHTRVR